MIFEAILIFLLGLIFGSFLNSLIYRLYTKLSLWQRSICPKCRNILRLIDLIPFLSFIFLGGKCKKCRKKISWQYPLVELITGILFVLVFLKNGVVDLMLFRDLFFVFVLIFILVFDWKYYLILDKIVWPALAMSLILNLFLGLNWLDLILGMAIGSGFFLIQYLFSRGQWVGEGDIKLGLLIGAMLGWQSTLLVFILAYLIGGLVAVILLLASKKKFGDILPMGTFLAAAAIIVLLAGEKILSWYF
ncbi:MAG: prepilin peptidase [Patescibacteria group bacterium]